MPSRWLNNVIRLNVLLPVCCRLQCLRRSSQTLWEHRPLETGPCWTQWADRSSRRLRLLLWPAFSLSLPWLQTRSSFKTKGNSGLRPADILSTWAKRTFATDIVQCWARPCARCSFQLCWQNAKTSHATNEDEPITFLKSKVYRETVHKLTNIWVSNDTIYEIKSLRFWLYLRSDEEPFFHHVTFPLRCVWYICCKHPGVGLQLSFTNNELYAGRFPPID